MVFLDAEEQGEMHEKAEHVNDVLGTKMQALATRLASPEGVTIDDTDCALYNLLTIVCAIVEDEDVSEDDKVYMFEGISDKLEAFLNEGL